MDELHESAFEGDMIEEESGWGGFADDGLGPADAGGAAAPWVRTSIPRAAAIPNPIPRTPSASNAKAVAGLRSSAPCASMGAAPAASEPQRAKLERIKRELDSVPTLPGVYLWKDKSGQVIYVGKAKQLRARMRQYVDRLPGRRARRSRCWWSRSTAFD